MRSWPSLLVWVLPCMTGCTAAPATPTMPIPAVDAVAPVRVETATFALG